MNESSKKSLYFIYGCFTLAVIQLLFYKFFPVLNYDHCPKVPMIGFEEPSWRPNNLLDHYVVASNNYA